MVAIVLQDWYCARGGGLNLKCHSAQAAAREMELDLNSVSEHDQGNLPSAKDILLSDYCSFKSYLSLPAVFWFCLAH